MSADLLAEFGSVDSTSSASYSPSSSQERSNANVLIPGFQSTSGVSISQQNSRHVPLQNLNDRAAQIIFDADDEAKHVDQDTDDFGDFEKASGTGIGINDSPLATDDALSRVLDLVSLENDQSHTRLLGTAANLSPTRITTTDHSAIGPRAVSTNGGKDRAIETKPEAITLTVWQSSIMNVAEPLPDSDDDLGGDWDVLEDHKPIEIPPLKAQPRVLDTATSIAPEKHETESHHSDAKLQVKQRQRPTNVPPPALLLQILPQVFQSLGNKVSHEVEPFPDLAAEIVQAFSVAARIMAGRALRWKRDIILSQSTKIGPAATRKTGGMKLASIDRSETLKEEREASDAISAWSHHAHSFNAIVAKSGVRRPLMALSVRNIPRSLQGEEVIYASYVCAMCGLRRDERLTGVDVNVSDSFEEFWIEHWGHRDCANFWDSYNDLLHAR